MPKKRLTILMVYIVLFITFPAFGIDVPDPVRPETVGLSSERLKRIDNLMNSHVEENKIGGSVVLVARRGKIAYFKTFGKADIDKPMQLDTIFRIASMTKPLVTAATMLLYEEGRILLSDPISKYIPEFKRPKVLTLLPEGSDPDYKLVLAKREITIRDLMTHKAGITYIFVTDWFKDRKHNLLIDMYRDAGVVDGLCHQDGGVARMVSRLARLPLIGQPGEVWEYGLSTDVLGYLVEKVSGMKLNDFLRERLLKPLKMNDTYFVVPQNKRARVSAVWQSDWKGNLEKMGPGPIQIGGLTVCPGDVYENSGGYLSGGAGMYSTVYDYFRFSQMLLNKGEYEGVRLLSRKTVELMTATNHIGDFDATFLHSKGWKFGLGFSIQKDRGQDVDSGSKEIFEWAGIYSTRFSVDPAEEKITILMTQTQPFSHHTDLWDKTLVLSASAVID